MKELQLQPRLQLLADMVPPGGCVADVGTDHGYLPVYLLQHRRVARAIASDIGEAPLRHARSTAAEYGIEGIDFRLSDGLRDIRAHEADTIVMAGMGGETMIAILSAAPWTKDGRHTLLLQPMTKAELLRPWLADSGYAFTEERLVADKGFLYPVIAVTGGAMMPLTEVEARAGILLENEALYPAYLDQWIGRVSQTVEGLRHSSREENDALVRRQSSLLAALQEKRSMV